MRTLPPSDGGKAWGAKVKIRCGKYYVIQLRSPRGVGESQRDTLPRFNIASTRLQFLTTTPMAIMHGNVSQNLQKLQSYVSSWSSPELGLVGLCHILASGLQLPIRIVLLYLLQCWRCVATRYSASHLLEMCWEARRCYDVNIAISKYLHTCSSNRLLGFNECMGGLLTNCLCISAYVNPCAQNDQHRWMICFGPLLCSVAWRTASHLIPLLWEYFLLTIFPSCRASLLLISTI